MSKADLPPEESERVKVPRLPTNVITVSGSINTTEEATIYVKDLDMFVTVQLLEDSFGTVSGKTLRRKWVFIRVERRPTPKSCQEWQDCTLHAITSCL